MSGKELLERIARDRAERSRLILAKPTEFKICNCCQSILFTSNVYCPFCKGYGFEFDQDKIVAMARLLGDRPLALGCAVLPRQTTVKAFSLA
jgi:hypothetical protein